MVYAVIAEAVLPMLLLLGFILMLKWKNSELMSREATLKSLRVVNHDYKNKMHVLMGYIETGRFEDARCFMNDVSPVPTEELMRVSGVIKNPSVASLIVGKLIEAKELGITINILPDSICKTLTAGIPEKAYITLIGNLLQNAIDELESGGSGPKNIDLFINTGKRWSLISVLDNGNGINPDDMDNIFKIGYTTKAGTNRGLGLGIAKSIAEEYGGNIEITSEAGEGTEVIVSMNGK